MSAIEIPGYKILKTLGVGGQATVYLAIQQGFDREVALKVMSPALAADPSFGERFIREAKIVAKLSHPRIVTVYDVGESGNFYYLAMEYMGGEELKTQIAKGLKAKQALVIIAKVAQALHFAHKKGYIHRDVKSENILFDDSEQPVLTDFGIAKASNSSTQMTQTGKLIGTPEYMSPEQCRGRKLDGRSDLYGLGVVLFEMMTRKVPFSGDDSVSVCIQHVTKPIPKLPARLSHLQWLIDGLLAKNPADRFQTGQELAVAIKKFLSEGVSSQRHISPAKKTKISKVIKGGASQEIVEEQQGVDGHYLGEGDLENEESSFELGDDFIIERRIDVSQGTKSRVPLIATVIILVAGVGLAGLLQDRWMPPLEKMFGLSDAQQTQAGSVPKSNNIKEDSLDTNEGKRKNKSEENKNDSSVNKNKASEKQATKQRERSEGQATVEQLIQRADTLAQYSPHELTDIKQALDILINAKSLDANNSDVIRTKKNIIEIALQQSLLSAGENKFENADEWLRLVESADSKNSELEKTRKNIYAMKQKYLTNVSGEERRKQEVNQLLAQADKAIEDKRLSTPTQNNAIYHIKKILQIDKTNTDVVERLKQINDVYLKLITQAITNNSFSKANKYLRILKTLPQQDRDLKQLEDDISKARRAFNEKQESDRKLAAAEAKRVENKKRRDDLLADPLVQMRLQSSLDAAELLMSQGNFVQPIGNNALEKYRAVLEIDANDPIANAGISKIETNIRTNIEVAISNQIETAAIIWIEKLKIFNLKHEKLGEYQLMLDEMLLSKEIESQTNDILEPELENESPSDNDSQDLNSDAVDADVVMDSTHDSKEPNDSEESKESEEAKESNAAQDDDLPEPEPEPESGS